MLWELLTAAALLSSPQVQPAVDCAVDQWRGAAAVASVGHDLPDGWGWQVECGPSPDEYWGRTRAAERVVTVWPAMIPTQHDLEDLLLHELGHVAATELDEIEKVRWMVHRGGEWSGDWSGWTACNPSCRYDAYAEDFAETWSHCNGHGDPSRHWDHYGPVPTNSDCEVLASIVD